MSKHFVAAAIAGFMGAVAVCAAEKPVTVQLKDTNGQSVGSATLSEGKGGSGVTIKLNLKNLTPGEHAVHFHLAAKCEGPAFTTAGGHFNPDKKLHGLQNPAGPHAGDMPNFTVKADGTSKATLTDPLVNLGSGDHSLFTGGGTALVIHAKADDMKTDPSGNSGDRIACGTIAK
jgi:Cu-Zn family superoxide dismutase